MLKKTDKLLWSDHLAGYRDYERLDQIRDELNFELPREILIYADLGLWNGRRTGYKEITTGVLSRCFYSDYEPTWYIDENNDLRCIDIHHDGTNYYLYRMYKEGISDEEKEELLENICQGVATEEDIMELTEPIGPYINEIYPWTKPEEELKHGKWMCNNGFWFGEKPFYCSLCGEGENERKKYCPNCGTPMDGE